MLVIAGKESALAQVHVHVGTEVTCNGPVRTETTELRAEITEIRVPLVLGVVGISANLVLCRFCSLDITVLINGHVGHILVAKGRRENTNVDYRFKIIGRKLSTDVCTQEGIVKRIVGVVIVNGLNGLGLHVSGKLESGFLFRFFRRGSFGLRCFRYGRCSCGSGFCRGFICRGNGCFGRGFRNRGFSDGSFGRGFFHGCACGLSFRSSSCFGSGGC